MRTLGLSWCLVGAALAAPAVLRGGDVYLQLLWAFRWWTLVTAVLWVAPLNYVFRQVLVIAMRTPGARMRAEVRVHAEARHAP